MYCRKLCSAAMFISCRSNLDFYAEKIYFSLELGQHVGPLCMFTDQKMMWKLNDSHFQHHQKLVVKYVDNKAELELQCLFAIQYLIHKLEHPQGKYYRTVHVRLKWMESCRWLWPLARYLLQHLTINYGRVPTKVS